MSAAATFLRDTQIMALNSDALRFDHSLFAIEKQTIYKLFIYHNPQYICPPTFNRSITFYTILAPLAFAVLYLLRLRRMPLLNQYMALTILSVILPYVSYEYTLVHIYLVFAVFLLFLLFLLQDGDIASIACRGSKLNIAMACFAIAFAPLAYLGHEWYQGQIKGLALVVLLAVTVLSPMPSTLFGDRPRACHQIRLTPHDLTAGGNVSLTAVCAPPTIDFPSETAVSDLTLARQARSICPTPQSVPPWASTAVETPGWPPKPGCIPHPDRTSLLTP
jgi:hypothetical protein